jgi:hypothetical protein
MKVEGIILILFGLYAAIRFKYNAKASLRSSKKLARILSFGKAGKDISQSEIAFAQFMYLIGGIIFIIIGLAKLFS